jgi:UDP-N-acetylglucosamine transferase subunit ALG13
VIFVTVGTSSKSFNRLIKKVDELIEMKKIKDDVIIQIGHSTYIPKNAQWFRFKPYNEMRELNKKARLVITHGGVGSILTALFFGKTVIAVPRLKKYNEHVDDHQSEFVKELDNQGKVKGVFDIDDLEDAIKSQTKLKFKPNNEAIVEEIRNYLNAIERKI